MLFRNDDKKNHLNAKTSSANLYKQDTSASSQHSGWNTEMERALLLKTYEETTIVGFLSYRGEIKGIRFFDARRNQFIDVAPWHLNSFSLSKLKLMGIRHIELFRHEHGDGSNTLLIEFLTKYEIEGRYRPIRMISNQVVDVLSEIERYMSDEQYELLKSRF